MKVVSYLRCSGDSQKLGDTWDRQQESILKYATAHDMELIREFRDEGLTGKTELEGRAGLSDCISYVQTHGITVVLVEDQTRLARDLIVAEVCVREFQRLGVQIIAASSGVNLTEGDDSNPTAKLIRQILAAVSEFERCCIVIRLRSARDRIRAVKGKCDGRKAYGEKPEELETLTRMSQLRASGFGYKGIANFLNYEGRKTRYGKPWRASSIQKILMRDTKEIAA